MTGRARARPSTVSWLELLLLSPSGSRNGLTPIHQRATLATADRWLLAVCHGGLSRAAVLACDGVRMTRPHASARPSSLAQSSSARAGVYPGGARGRRCGRNQYFGPLAGRSPEMRYVFRVKDRAPMRRRSKRAPRGGRQTVPRHSSVCLHRAMNARFERTLTFSGNAQGTSRDRECGARAAAVGHRPSVIWRT